jgi:hypothetical protein
MRSNDYLTDKQVAEQRLDRLQRKRERILRNAGHPVCEYCRLDKN